MVPAATEATVCVNKGQTESGLPAQTLPEGSSRQERCFWLFSSRRWVNLMPLAAQIVPQIWNVFIHFLSQYLKPRTQTSAPHYSPRSRDKLSPGSQLVINALISQSAPHPFTTSAWVNSSLNWKHVYNFAISAVIGVIWKSSLKSLTAYLRAAPRI